MIMSGDGGGGGGGGELATRATHFHSNGVRCSGIRRAPALLEGGRAARRTGEARCKNQQQLQLIFVDPT
jgi:hypothetical protein